MTDGTREPPLTDPRDEDVTSQLLRLAGARPDVPRDRTERVRSAVRLHWTSVARRRVIRRRVILTGAALAAAAVLVILVRTTTSPDRSQVPAAAATVATIERAEGNVRLGRVPGEAAWVTLKPGTPVRTGDWLETDASAQVALRLADATSARLDVASQARLVSAQVIELASGGVYLDTGTETSDGSAIPRNVRLEVRTPLGVARDIGTQFEVRVHERTLRLRVRRGAVELQRGAEVVHAPSGTELRVSPEGVERAAVTPYGRDWQWAARLAPAFDIEGQSVTAFLEHWSREYGWTVRFADPALESEASRILLHGSVRGLDPAEALEVALTTSGLTSQVRNGELVVSRLTLSK